ncbi:hypothetical protein JW766_03255 [Candidatus Dojkabacteria bacterium]|nr:hypothetical protein [Candidatus Dojkabacteria bacterium]
MNKKQKISLLVVVALLIMIPVVTGIFQRSGFEIRISALEEDDPRNTAISDIKDTSFKVCWITEREVIGGVLLSDGTRFSESDKTSYHSVTVTGLESVRVYEFKLLSGTKEFTTEAGSDYSVTTASVSGTGDDFLIYGQVFSPDGYSFQQGGVLTLVLEETGKESQVLATTINETGGYQFNLGRLLANTLDRDFPYKKKVNVTLNVFISFEQQAVEKKYTVDLTSNRQIPNVYLGEVNIDIIPGIEGSAGQ